MLEKTGSVSSQNKLLKIGELAEQADVAVGTVRYYETLRLLEPTYRTENGYRYYAPDAIKRLKFIRKAQSLQFSLSEIQQILDVRKQGKAACPIVQDLLNQKITFLEKKIYQMEVLKAELEAYREHWAEQPYDDPYSQELCTLIEQVANINLTT